MNFRVVETPAETLLPSFLSPQQRDICELRASGLSDKTIAHRLGITRSALGSQVHRINAKLKDRGFLWAYVIVREPLATETTGSRVGN